MFQNILFKKRLYVIQNNSLVMQYCPYCICPYVNVVSASEAQHYAAAGWYFTCKSVQMIPYLQPFQVWLKDLSQGLGSTVQATEKVEQGNYEVISGFAALCRCFQTALLANIWKQVSLSQWDKTNKWADIQHEFILLLRSTWEIFTQTTRYTMRWQARSHTHILYFQFST